MAIIDYSAATPVVAEGTHVVYAKANWLAAWTEMPNLKCVECQWNAAPAMNTAVLRWDVGSVILPGDSSATVFGPWVGRGQFIRIDWQCDDASILRWVGFVDAADWPQEDFGSQALVCFGLEQSLAKTPLADIVWRRAEGEGIRSPYPLTFGDAPRLGLRSADPITAAGEDYAFAAHDDAAAVPWSTRKAVDYLLRFHLPTSTWGVANIPWALDQATQLPDWDQVYLETRNRTVWDLLVALISPDKQLGFTVGSDGSTAYLRVFTHLQTTLTIGSNSLLANPNQHSISSFDDALTEARFRDMGGGYDQIIVRGARRQSICTLSYDDLHLENDWSASLETQYETGASAEAGYGAATTEEKQQRNAVVRGRNLLSQVFRRLKLPDDWDYMIGLNAVFPDNDDPHSIELEPRLPVKPDVDWDGAVSTDDFDRDGEGIAMLVFWQNPDDTAAWVENQQLEALSPIIAPEIEFDFTVRPTLPAPRKLDLTVVGGPQHVIAMGTFTKLGGEDIDGQIDVRKVKVTAALAENRFVEGVYPTTPPAADVIRRLVVDLGESFHQVYIVPDTITEVTTFAGAQLTSTGGYLVDDSEEIQALAQVIAGSLLLTRKSVSWSSQRKISTIAVGDLITTAAGATVIAPITAVHIKAPLGLGHPAKATVQSFEVYRGALDPIGVLHRLGGATAATDLRTDLKFGSQVARKKRRRSVL